MTRRIGYNELALRRCEIAVGYVDRDALLPLSAKAVSQKCEVHVFIAACFGASFHSFQLVLENCLTIIE